MNGVSSSSDQQCPTEQILEDECYFEDMSLDFRELADMTLVVEGQHELPCHSAILRLHSKVFDTLLKTDSFQEAGNKHTGVAAYLWGYHVLFPPLCWNTSKLSNLFPPISSAQELGTTATGWRLCLTFHTGVAGFFAIFHARGIQVQCADKPNFVMGTCKRYPTLLQWMCNIFLGYQGVKCVPNDTRYWLCSSP